MTRFCTATLVAASIVWRITPCAVILAIVFPESRGAAGNFAPIDTQTSGAPLTPRRVIASMSVPAGFKVTLATAEPDVRQPIAMCFDDRGRLWVAECYSYDGSDFTNKRDDRILIFADEDGDGVFESRKVFADGLNRLTGLALGFGGVWVLTAPTLSFIPDRDHDDRPDGPPTVVLEGWTLTAEHNSVNGMSWGPDGWLYGRHGNKEPSSVGRPGQPEAERIFVSCAVWRYHPTRRVFEVVADGTVNPWGHDWDDLGQLFMSTSVMDHLWHVVPGSHFRRNANVPMQEHVYELMDSIVDHSHRPRKAAGGKSDGEGGNGHSHVGLMIYLGDRWPESYRGLVYLNNVMGRRINQEKLTRDPATDRFRASHTPDFLKASDPWFRGVSVEYGPDGDVIVTDWSDNGECHDRDGVSRSTGRIYKISYGEPRRVAVALEQASNAELVALQRHRNDWQVRHARRLLQERATTGVSMAAVHRDLRQMFVVEATPALKLRALWALYVSGGATRDWLEPLLSAPDEAVRYWAIRLLVDTPETATQAGPALAKAALAETTWLGRMALASALNTVVPDVRWELGAALAAVAAKDTEPNLLRLIWSGWGTEVGKRPADALKLALTFKAPRLREWTVRRVAETSGARPEIIAALLRTLTADSDATVIDVMNGAEAGLRTKTVAGSANDASLTPLRALYASPQPPAQRAALRLGARLGDDRALRELCNVIADSHAALDWRRSALESLSAARPVWLAAELLKLLDRSEVAEPAIRALGALNDPAIAPSLIQHYKSFPRPARTAAIDALVARPASSAILLDALDVKTLAKTDLTRAQIRQLGAINDHALRARVEQVFGSTTPSSETTLARIRKLRYTLKDAAYMATADIGKGQAYYTQRCSVCHTLFGTGGKVGPDLTGSGRKDLDYLLTNILDPNASIAAEYRLAHATLTDGQVVSGALAAEHADSVVLQTVTGPVTVARAQIRSLERLSTSLMPTGLTDDLTVDQIRDLFAFLMSDTGVISQ